MLAIMKSSNSKAPGNDGIAYFWLRNLTSIHEELTTAYNGILKHPEAAPDWLTEGLTYLLPTTKSQKSEELSPKYLLTNIVQNFDSHPY